MNAVDIPFTLTYSMLLAMATTVITGLLTVMWASLKWGIEKQLKRTENLEVSVEEIKNAYVMKEHMKDIEEQIIVIKESYVSKGELKEVFHQLDKSITESGLTVRDALGRVHVRIDDIYKELYGSVRK
jgi:hypothetical protein